MKFITGFVTGIVFVLVLAVMLPDTEERVYDCSVAEWHPDTPAKVKEECRKRRYEHWKQEQKSV